eukprot:SAG11_NODE_28459_length_321_cov_0.936937_2_plen_75_part_01
MTVTIANQTANHFLALPDETGYLLSSSSSFSTLNTLGVLTGLEVAGVTALNSHMTLGDDQADEIRVNGSIVSDSV